MRFGRWFEEFEVGATYKHWPGKAIANLEVKSLKHVAPTFHGDTIYGETTFSP